MLEGLPAVLVEAQQQEQQVHRDSTLPEAEQPERSPEEMAGTLRMAFNPHLFLGI
jgi:hypothetical protein